MAAQYKTRGGNYFKSLKYEKSKHVKLRNYDLLIYACTKSSYILLHKVLKKNSINLFQPKFIENELSREVFQLIFSMAVK